jgi:hypothetical protein
MRTLHRLSINTGLVTIVVPQGRDLDSIQRHFDAFPIWHACKFSVRALASAVRAAIPVVALSFTHESAKGKSKYQLISERMNAI